MGDVRTGNTVQTEVVDALVVGSGFGGSVAAYRLAEAGKQVVLMERGRAYGPGDFARSPAELATAFWDPSNSLYGLFDAWTMRGLEGLVSSGLGGGSLIYANVLLRKDEHWFVHHSPLPGGGYEHWPIGRSDLEDHYQHVEDMIGVNPYPYRDTPKTNAFEQAARNRGLNVFRPPLAVSFATDPHAEPQPGRELPAARYGNIHGRARQTCTLCGECDLGCNTGAKNTLDHTYISAAVATGNAQVRTLHEVRSFAPRPDGSWLVRYVVHDPQHPTPTAQLNEQQLVCRKLILAAGTFGTTWLLLRNRANLPGLSSMLGTRFCSNGDLLGLVFNATEQVDGERTPRVLAGSRGPVITSTVRVPDAADGDGADHHGAEGRGYYLQDAGYPGFINWLMELSQVGSALPRSARIASRVVQNRLFQQHRTNISADLAAALGPGLFSNTSLPLLGMGRDVPDGRMFLRGGRLEIDWTLSTSTGFFDRLRGSMQEIAEELGANFRDNPLWWAKRIITVHPLGGAPLGDDPQSGVCDPFNEVYGCPGLYVVDGAALPGPVGANPSLTIAALSDRACEHLLDSAWQPVHRATGDTVPDAPKVPDTTDDEPDLSQPAAMDGSCVSFTETMRGHFTTGIGDPSQGNAAASLRHERMAFTLTIATEPIERFVADPRHPGSATGFVDADLLGGRCEVQRGWFNLFAPGEHGHRLMLYRLLLTAPGGRALTLVGYKDIHDGPGLDVWPDTTTLYVQVLDGHHPPRGEDPPTGLLDAQDERVVGSGVLYIHPVDFARQLTTFRASGPHGVRALGRFGLVFAQALYRSYLAPSRARGGGHEAA